MEPVISCTPETTTTVIPPEECPKGKKGRKCRKEARTIADKSALPAPVDFLAPKLVGHYKQVELVNMAAYLDAEGGSYFYKKMAQKVHPNLEIKEYPEEGYVQE